MRLLIFQVEEVGRLVDPQGARIQTYVVNRYRSIWKFLAAHGQCESAMIDASSPEGAIDAAIDRGYWIRF